MNILVCVSLVPDTTSKINFTADGSDFNATGVQFILNPSDESALNKALQIKEQTAGSVTILHAGTAENEPVLRKAFALGANAMIRIDMNPADGFSVAKNISEVIKNRSFDVILCGKESLDYHSGAVGGYIAGLLNYNFIDNVNAFSVEGNTITAQSETDTGIATYTASFPVVMSVQKEIVTDAELKIPNIRGIMMARTAPVEVIQSQVFSPSVKFSNYEKPAPKSPVKMIDANDLDTLLNAISPQIFN